MRIAAIALAGLMLLAGTARAQVKASPPSGPTQAPRPGPIEVVFRTFTPTISRLALTNAPVAMAQADSGMKAAYAAGDIPRAVAYRFFVDRQQVRGRDVQRGLADMESVLVVARSMRDTTMIARVWAS